MSHKKLWESLELTLQCRLPSESLHIRKKDNYVKKSCEARLILITIKTVSEEN